MSLLPGAIAKRMSGEASFMRASARVLRNDFPNPERSGCPDTSTLRGIASGRLRLKDTAPLMKHLGACSECFREFEGLKQVLRRRQLLHWSYAAAAAIVLIALSTLWLTGSFVRDDQRLALLDLRSQAPVRGTDTGEPNAGGSVLELKRSTKEITVLLPMGAEGDYAVELLAPSGLAAAAAHATGVIRDSSTALTFSMDLRQLRPGLYDLSLRRNQGLPRSYRVQLI